MAIGPVEYIIVGFPGNQFNGEIAPELAKLVESGTIRLLDLVFIMKDADGNTVAVFARRERGRDLLLLNALNGGIRERIEMPGVDQQLSPNFSPDG